MKGGLFALHAVLNDGIQFRNEDTAAKVQYACLLLQNMCSVHDDYRAEYYQRTCDDGALVTKAMAASSRVRDALFHYFETKFALL